VIEEMKGLKASGESKVRKVIEEMQGLKASREFKGKKVTVARQGLGAGLALRVSQGLQVLLGKEEWVVLGAR